MDTIEQQILQLTAPSDIRGRPINHDGPIGLYEIRFNRTHWKVPDIEAEFPFAMVEGYELVIRRKGHHIGIFRRKVKDAADER